MKMSRRAKRMAQHHRRHKRGGALNMVSLMDIFTILVFFLLVNASEVELITPPKQIALPESTSQTRPVQALTLSISQTEISLDQQKLLDVDADTGDTDQPIDTLVNALRPLHENTDEASTQLTILADRHIEYRLLKRVLKSCTAAGFEDLALAVLQVAEPLQ